MTWLGMRLNGYNDWGRGRGALSGCVFRGYGGGREGKRVRGKLFRRT